MDAKIASLYKSFSPSVISFQDLRVRAHAGGGGAGVVVVVVVGVVVGVVGRLVVVVVVVVGGGGGGVGVGGLPDKKPATAPVTVRLCDAERFNQQMRVKVL